MSMSTSREYQTSTPLPPHELGKKIAFDHLKVYLLVKLETNV